MRCSFRYTTALAAVLAILAPASLLAETVLPPQKAAAMDKASREDMPQRAAMLDAELANGLSAGMLTCVDDAQRPCPDDQVLVTPGGLAVRLAQDDAIVLAPRKAQREAAQTGKKGKREGGKTAAEAAPEANGEAAAAAKAAARGGDAGKKDKNASEVGADEVAKARKNKEKADRKAGASASPDEAALAASLAAAQDAADADTGAAATAVANDNAAPEAQAAQAPSSNNADEPVVSDPIPAATPEVKPSVAEAQPVVEEMPKAKAKQGKDGKKKRDMAAEAAATAEPVVAEPGAEDDSDAGKLAEALAAASGKATPAVEEPGAAGDKPVVADAPGAKASDADAAALAAALAAATGKAASPATDANAAAAKSAGAAQQVEAPRPVTVDEETSRSLEASLKAAAAAAEDKGAARAKKAKEAQQAASGKQKAGSGNASAAANAAASAAAAGTAPVADALNAPTALSDNATAVVVTEGSARSSSEDFATRITDGLTREQEAQFDQLRKQVAAQRDSGKPVVVGDTTSASEDDDDKGRDLARLLLAGVGGYALANILANNGQIALSTPDRVVVQQPDGSQSIIKDDNALLLQPGAQVTNENFADGSSRSIVTRADGSRVVTIRDANLQVLRRTLIAADGTVTELINDAQQVQPVVVSDLPPAARPVVLSDTASEDALRAALAREVSVNRSFTLGQIRNIPEVRALVAPIDINAITFDTGSAAISPDQAQQLATVGRVISDYVRSNPAEVFLIEGYTDTVGSAAMNLALSDRRAESVALALSQYFEVPPENLVVQGYGERFLKVDAEGDIRENRRASVRRITDLLATN